MGIYSFYGKGSDDFRSVQRSGRAPAARDPGVPGERRARSRTDRGGPAAGAAFSLEASTSAARSGAGAGAAQRTPHALQDERASAASITRVDGLLRETVD